MTEQKKKFDLDKFLQRSYQFMGVVGGTCAFVAFLWQMRVFEGKQDATIVEQKTTNNKLDTLIDVSTEKKKVMDTLMDVVKEEGEVSLETRQKLEKVQRDEQEIDRRIARMVTAQPSPKVSVSSSPQNAVASEGASGKSQEKTVASVDDGFATQDGGGFSSSSSMEKKEQTRVQASADRLAVSFMDAVLWGDQQITDGSTVRFRVEEPTKIGGRNVDRNTVFTGIAHRQGGRNHIEIREIGNVPVEVRVHEKISKAAGLPLMEKYPDRYRVLLAF